MADIKTIRLISYPKISHEIPIMDVTLKLIFDEDLSNMIFPKVREFEIRANSGSPVELCAKILAIQNGHKEKWQNYSFSYQKISKKLNEVQITDLRKTFA